MQGKYKTTDGQILEVIEFDEPNKSVRVDLGSGQSKWYSESEYCTWVKDGEAPDEICEPEPTQEVIEAPIVEEGKQTVKKRKTIKKIK